MVACFHNLNCHSEQLPPKYLLSAQSAEASLALDWPKIEHACVS